MRTLAFGLLVMLTGLTLGCGNTTKDTGGGGGGGGGSPTDDKAALQGTWKIVNYQMEFPPDEKDNPFKELIREVLTGMEVTIKDNLVTAVVTNDKGLTPKYFTFTTSPSKSPKEVDLTEADEKGTPKPTKKFEGFDAKTGKVKEKEGPPSTTRGIYKFDGDTLVVALGMGEDARPTEFKAVAPKNMKDESGGVIVLHLKKK